MISLFKKVLQRNKKWEDIEYFDENWKNRIKIMSLFIKNEKNVLDIGCWKMWLKGYLWENKTYIGLDYKDRGWNYVCDLNNEDFPNIKCDVVFMSGVLEYINDYEKLIKDICDLWNKSVIISYCAIDYKINSDIKFRKKLTWVNHLSINDLVWIFEKENFYKEKIDINYNWNYIFKFTKNEQG